MRNYDQRRRQLSVSFAMQMSQPPVSEVPTSEAPFRPRHFSLWLNHSLSVDFFVSVARYVREGDADLAVSRRRCRRSASLESREVRGTPTRRKDDDKHWMAEGGGGGRATTCREDKTT